jgi:(2Fe-2S) ferredoxin
MATSHVGGHNIAGNMIIYRPGWKQGIWYGRVSPCDVDDIIRETVVGGKILARYWRGGLPNGMWDPKQHISGEEAALQNEQWREEIETCACQNSGS